MLRNLFFFCVCSQNYNLQSRAVLQISQTVLATDPGRVAILLLILLLPPIGRNLCAFWIQNLALCLIPWIISCCSHPLQISRHIIHCIRDLVQYAHCSEIDVTSATVLGNKLTFLEDLFDAQVTRVIHINHSKREWTIWVFRTWFSKNANKTTQKTDPINGT